MPAFPGSVQAIDSGPSSSRCTGPWGESAPESRPRAPSANAVWCRSKTPAKARVVLGSIEDKRRRLGAACDVTRSGAHVGSGPPGSWPSFGHNLHKSGAGDESPC